jgi:glycosyltransferase involved in cell wall biosynthesis
MRGRRSAIIPPLLRILIVHQYYLVKGRPGGSRFNELARLWSEAGHQVTVLAGAVDYQTGETPEAYRGRWLTEEQDGPVRVFRCYVPESYASGYHGRMWGFFVFTLSAASAILRGLAPDVVIASSPPLTAVLPGYLAAFLSRAHFVFEIRDSWPESAVTTGVLDASAPLTKGLYLLEKWACRLADRIGVLTPAFADDLVRRGLASADKVVFVPNGADVALFAPGPRDNEVRRQYGWGDRFVVMYAGAHGRANALGQLVDAAELLRSRRDILIACVGDGPERLAVSARAAERGVDNIVFLGAQPKERMPALINACDVGAAVLQNNPTFRAVYPNKVFDYMACERPTLVAIDGIARELVCERAQAGVYAEPENPRALADTIAALAADPVGRRRMGRNGRAWVLENATRDALARRYLETLAGLVRGGDASVSGSSPPTANGVIEGWAPPAGSSALIG